MFIYGGLAHANPEKKNIYDEWMKKSIIREFLENQFTVILSNVLRIIVYVAKLNDDVISQTQVNF